jgi:hypothetical protein
MIDHYIIKLAPGHEPQKRSRVAIDFLEWTDADHLVCPAAVLLGS